MRSWKKTLGIVVSLAAVLAVAVTFFSVAGTSSGDTVEIRLAHNQAAGSEIADSIAKISEFAAEDPSQGMERIFFPFRTDGSVQGILSFR